MSVFSILAALSAIKFLEYNNLICIGLISFSGAVIFCLAPVDTENKPLDEIEKIIYRKKALIICKRQLKELLSGQTELKRQNMGTARLTEGILVTNLPK